jgi:dTDP-4-amino-4,6-dideoxygalactose transaminase
MRPTFLPFSPPSIGEDEINEVVDTLRSGWLTTGSKAKRFEDEFCAFLNADSALALNSCTGAVHVALATLSIGPGDSVITTPMSFCSSVHAIEHVGARPVFVDVERATLNLDPTKTREIIKRLVAERGTGKNGAGRVKAILPVHLYGHPCDMDDLVEIAQEFELAIVDDAAHSLPAKYRGSYIGSSQQPKNVPLLTCFSFYATKNLTTGEGGMLTGPQGLIDEARIWSLHGMTKDAWSRGEGDNVDDRSWHYEVIRPGFKYNLSDIQAAIGLHQLRKLPEFHSRRTNIARQYNQAFCGYEELEVPTPRPHVEHAWHLYVLQLNTDLLEISRDRFIQELKNRRIGASVHFTPVHLHPFYRDKYGYAAEDFPIALERYHTIVSLPIYPSMTDADVQDVIAAVSEVVEESRNKRVWLLSATASSD